MIRQLWGITTTDDIQAMIEEGDDGISRVKGLIKSVRFMLFAFMVLPKMLISLALLVLGTMWLVATDDFSDLILNAVALEFVIKLDELIFECMVPQTVKQDLANAKLWIPMKMSALTEDEQKAKATTDGLIRSWIWYIVIILGAYAYL